MAGSRELGFPKTSACSLREQLARTTLHNVRSQGHTYVELREDGKRYIFFCTLCLAPCYSDAVLFDHLKGNLHTERLGAAKATLLKPNPWPFNDGVLFFQCLSEQDNQPIPDSTANRKRLLALHNGDRNKLAVVCHEEQSNPINVHIYRNRCHCNKESYSVGSDLDCDGCSPDRHVNSAGGYDKSHYRCLNGNGGPYDLVVPGVLHGDEIFDLEVRFMGVGQIAARFFMKDEITNGICRIWCEWLGKNQNVDSLVVPEHDFAIVSFAYNYGLGRKGLVDDVVCLLSTNPWEETDGIEDARKKRKKSFSDPEDISESLSKRYDSSGEDSHSSNSCTSRILLQGYDEQLLLHSRVTSSKKMRRELRRQQQVAAERMCDICQQKILPGKDVATLLNRKTGRLVCSSRNVNGAFHLFHISCIIHWILLCELEIYTKQLLIPKVKRRSRRKPGVMCNVSKEACDLGKQIYSTFCPECQGTGIIFEGDELEKPTVPLSEMFKYKIKVSDARRAWMKSPEVLTNCSTGFHFPSLSNELVQENVLPLKSLHFYRADG